MQRLETLLTASNVLHLASVGIAATDTAGFELVAEEKLKAGSLVIVEKSLAKVVQPVNHYDSLPPIQANLDVAQELLRTNHATEALTYLEPRDQKQLAPVMKAHGDEIEQAVQALKAACQKYSDEQLCRLLAICMHNNFMPMHDGTKSEQSYGLWLTASLFNHSCSPNCIQYGDINARHVDDDCFDHLVIRTVCDVEAGESLTLSYLELTLPSKARQALLLDHYGFACQCPRCEREAQAKQQAAVLDVDQVERACHYAMTMGNLKPLQVLLLKGAQSGWNKHLDHQYFQLQDTLARCHYDQGQAKEALAALEAALVVAEHCYPSNWPTLTSLYRRGHSYAKAAGQASKAARFADSFNRTRAICRGVRCSNNDCKRFVLAEIRCTCCEDGRFCNRRCAQGHRIRST
eukprot:TRINITY_DN6223_c0_g1_i2.p1 TRINITY_DN6223_c0_g1~~TRINITY_DN6223_c0_g1_i2.p1  ORF type:complete len:405 (+),score=80.45 TRINITY_DN6223_c0_g1_i2:177-1391(+)